MLLELELPCMQRPGLKNERDKAQQLQGVTTHASLNSFFGVRGQALISMPSVCVVTRRSCYQRGIQSEKDLLTLGFGGQGFLAVTILEAEFSCHLELYGVSAPFASPHCTPFACISFLFAGKSELDNNHFCPNPLVCNWDTAIVSGLNQESLGWSHVSRLLKLSRPR